MAMWGGRFTEATLSEFRDFNDSLSFDYLLAQQDIAASRAWTKGLQQAAIITADEASQLEQGLADLAIAIESDPRLPLQTKEEDIHSWVESQLTAKLGSVAKKLHTGRSRNDLVATDLRLWTRLQAGTVRKSLLAALAALLEFADQAKQAVMPGYTHLQRAQPVLVAHWALAYVEMFKRDLGRLDDALVRLDSCPLGCGALAGTGINIDRQVLASELGFGHPALNSLDAVSDRDYLVELSAAASLCMTHLSRLSEDVIFFCSGEAGFFKLGDAISSGSSLMPQKKNPDVFELLRGKTGRVLGHLVAILHVLKGLPLAFRDAHECAGELVLAAAKQQLPLEALSLSELQQVSELIADDVYPALTLEAGMARRCALGGTASVQVMQALATAKSWFEKMAQSG